MTDKVLKTVLEYNMLRNGDRVLCALSGGADSMALLHVLLFLKDTFSLEIYAAHLNHGLRGDESERDEKFVQEYCERHGIKLFIKRADMNSEAKKKGESVEVCGREARYVFFEETARSLGGAKIATAHTLSDRAETLILQITRGSGTAGLRSIPAVRGEIIRPLFDCTRQEIEEYCKAEGIPYVTDSTNLGDMYTRNKLRHNVIPLLKEINQNFETAAARLMSAAADDNDLLFSIASSEYRKRLCEKGMITEGFEILHPALQSRVLLLFFKENRVEESSKYVFLAKQAIKDGGRFSVGKDMFIEALDGILTVLKAKKGPASKIKPCIIPCLDEPVSMQGMAFAVMSREEYERKQKVYKNFFICTMDYDKIIGNLILRGRTQGDRIRLPKRPARTLKKLFIEEKVPHDKRDSIYVLADDNGVLAVFGFGPDERCAVTEETVRVLTVFHHDKENGVAL